MSNRLLVSAYSGIVGGFSKMFKKKSEVVSRSFFAGHANQKKRSDAPLDSLHGLGCRKRAKNAKSTVSCQLSAKIAETSFLLLLRKALPALPAISVGLWRFRRV
jgi:hypothetical protein